MREEALIEHWRAGISDSFSDVGAGVINYVPQLVVALIVFIAGWIIASVLGRVVSQLVQSLQLDRLLQRTGVEELLSRGGFHLDTGRFLGELVKWFILVVFLVAAFDILGLTQVNDFLKEVVLTYLPNVIAAVLILLFAALIADVMQRLVTGSAYAAELEIAPVLGGVVRWAILVLGIIIALDQLGFLRDYGTILFQGVVYFLVIAGGLAFGLGGKEAAADLIESVRRDVSRGRKNAKDGRGEEKEKEEE